MKITINENNIVGKIKPMHGVNNMPTNPYDHYGLFHYYTDASIPFARLHDTGEHYVDIGYVFPNPEADENDVNSYDFAFTDILIKNIIDTGVKPLYRLGCSIENYRSIKPYYINPPIDNLKWAKICQHIIMHYNEGWDNGFHYGIEYWELWNEPDNEPDSDKNPMWNGSKEQYFELYNVASKYLKERFPTLKIGGYASCGFYSITKAGFVETAHSTDRLDYFVEFFLDFLKFISENKCPLDFFSWHSYAWIDDNELMAAYCREKLDAYGYTDTITIFDEWNPGIHNRTKAVDCANITAQMISMQNTCTNICCYYDGNIHSSYCGLFNPITRSICKGYYAFYYFGFLYRAGNQVECCNDCIGVYTLAAKDNDGKLSLIIANPTDKEYSFTVEGASFTTAFVTDEESENEQKAISDAINVKPHSTLLLC